MNSTPLRYPGGKSIMTSFFKKLFTKNTMNNVIYSEPYAGGAGAAMNLLIDNAVDAVIINDADIGVYSFWQYLKEDTNSLIDLINATEVTLNEWHKQRHIYKNIKTPSLELGFATFFLSRANRSGILHAGPMGGQDPLLQELSNNKLDCRFNKKDLINRIEKIALKKDRLDVFNLDALSFLNEISSEDVFVYLDPPYYKQGHSLYLNYYTHHDHLELSEFLKNNKDLKWILSYDNVEAIQLMYNSFEQYYFDLNYSAQDIKKGRELLVHSRNLSLPNPCEIERKTKNIKIKKLDKCTAYNSL